MRPEIRIGSRERAAGDALDEVGGAAFEPLRYQLRPAISRHRARRLIVFWLLAPTLVCEVLVFALPVAAAVYSSFTQVNQYTVRHWLTAPFVGLSNYRLILSVWAVARPMLRSFEASVLYVAVAVSISVFLGTVAVVFVRTLGKSSARVLQPLYILPFAIPGYAGVLAWSFIFQGGGPADSLVHNVLHLTRGSPLFLVDGSTAFWVLIITAVWHTWPFVFLMFLAATQNIPAELYESVRIDGGGRWKEVHHVTLPFIRGSLELVTLVLCLWTFNDFTTPFVLFGASPTTVVDTFPLFVYVNSFDTFLYSLGSAMTLVAVIVLMLIALPMGRKLKVLDLRDA